MEEDLWAAVADRFVDVHYGSVRGKVRTQIVHHQLRQHLPPPPAAIVDVGGGAGHQALPLARDGYRVVLIDPSPAMLNGPPDCSKMSQRTCGDGSSWSRRAARRPRESSVGSASPGCCVTAS